MSLLFRWRRQVDGKTNARPGAANGARPAADGASRTEVKELRDRVRELERLLGRKTLEAELMKQELARLGHTPDLAALAQAAPAQLVSR